MKITVAICTWNRAGLLDQTLCEMRNLRIPDKTEWELLVINNNCTDNTEEVAIRHMKHLPLRHILEARQGKSNALNRAMGEAKGDVILWTDDDVLVSPDWLAEYVSAFESHPNASILGGPVHAWLEGTPPSWLDRVWSTVATAYAVREFVPESFRLCPQRIPFGANFAIRTQAQRRYPYDPNLGPNKSGTLRGEEVDVILQLLSNGEEGWWVPNASVRHFIPRSRQSISYLRGFFQGQGEFIALKEPIFAAVPRLFGAPRWLLRKAIQAEVSYRVSRLIRSPEVWIGKLITSSMYWGQVRGCRVNTTGN